MKTRTVMHLLGFAIFFLLGVFAASGLTYGTLSSTGPLIFLYPLLVRFSPIGLHIKFLFIDSFPIPALVLGHESLLILPTNYPLYLSLLYTATIAVIMILVFSIPALLIKPLLRMPEYEHFHDAWARVKFLFTKSSWKKRLTTIFITIILITIYLIMILFHMVIFQILHLTYTDTLILLFALPPLLLLFLALYGDRLFSHLYKQD
ncbi:MAG: hypothetical protein QW261_11925 [Candidatus Jordarchaeaceae archaeon]